MNDQLSDEEIAAILRRTRRIAVVGASNKPSRPSFGVMKFLIGRGFVVTPVNPGLAGETILGCAVAGTIEEAGPLDMVDLFRNSAEIEAPVAEAIRLGAKTIWMQLGVFNQAAAEAARAAGLAVVINRCPAIEMPRLGI
jgi:predicted CoA-binding protein